MNLPPSPVIAWPRLAPVLLCFFGLACQTVSPLAPANLREPGWSVREGQAVWGRKRGAPEIAGDLVLATRGSDRVFAQFSKGPFPLLIAQKTAQSWEVQVPTENKRYSGRGRPPARVALLNLAQVLAGGPPPKGWSWQRQEDNTWELRNPATGEFLRGYLNQ